MKNHRLNTLCKKMDIELTQHHRAIYDTEATGYLLVKMLKDVIEKGFEYHASIKTIVWDKGMHISAGVQVI